RKISETEDKRRAEVAKQPLRQEETGTTGQQLKKEIMIQHIDLDFSDFYESLWRGFLQFEKEQGGVQQ
ncbi:MAG: hypothetical protein PHQ23_12925, partial [Candidatus Wallbacteria bacterium]|nr:hypothetical protein [Candidatus Wallbacteria bacterium]